jgi:hypothetical protein
VSRRLWFIVWIAGGALVAVILFLGPILFRPGPPAVAAPVASDSPTPIPITTPVRSTSPLPSVPPTESDPHGLAVVIVASELGFVAARTDPGAICTATASLGGDVGLEQPRTANAYGRVEFSYHTTGKVPTTGLGVHTISCTLGDRHGSSTTWYNASGA